MPKVSRMKSSAPADARSVRKNPEMFYCTRCDKGYKGQRGHFFKSRSTLYKANDEYMTICKDCVEELFRHYLDALGSERAAVRRICLKLDIYWSDKLYEAAKASLERNSRGTIMGTYFVQANVSYNFAKTFDTTLDEEDWSRKNPVQTTENSDDEDYIGGDIEPGVPEEVIDFWGSGLAPSFYFELERRLSYWGGDRDRNAFDVAEIAIIKQICLLEVTINRDSAAGKPIEK